MTNIKERSTPKKGPAAKKTPPVKPLPDDVLRIISVQAKLMTGRELADKLGVSTSAVSQAVNNKFVGNVDRFCLRVRGVFAGDSVTCPVLGTLTTKLCLEQQGKPIAYTNPVRVQVQRACKTCPHHQRNQQPQGEPHDQ